jgi:cytochrome c556
LASLGATSFAHNGATGVVMDRMMGMSAMKDVMASLAPMMQGESPFDVRMVQENAARIIAHSGENMTRLFPEGSLQPASFTKPEIWEEWEDFEALSEQLKTYALGLAMAAPNGLTAPAPDATAPSEGAMDHGTMQMGTSEVPDPSSSGMMDHGSMQMGTAPEPAPSEQATTYTVAELLGVTRPVSLAQPAPAGEVVDAIDFSMMAADDVFEQVSQICSSCHARFRTGS